MNDYLSSLNRQQREAVEHGEGPSVILAGAGSGKTRVLVSKVVHLVSDKKTDPESIVMITFTNKAAAEMKERIAAALFGRRHSLGYVGTFHSFCAMILRRDGHHAGIDPGYTIYDDDDQETVIKNVLKKMESKRYTPSFLSFRISSAKNSLITPDRYAEMFSDSSSGFVAEAYRLYQKELENNHALDFDDLIMKTVKLFMEHPEVLDKYQSRYRQLLVDEFQDTNYAQYALTRILGGKSRNVTVVGDFSQSIYSWRGADIRNLEKFREDFPEAKVFYLDENYRSTQTILDFAYSIISKNQTHPVLQLRATNAGGEEIAYYEAEHEQDEAMFVASEIERLQDGDPYSSFAVLYRTNAQSRAIEEAFLHLGIPYVLIGGTRFYERKEVKDILSYLRLVVNPSDEISLERIRKIGKRKFQKFKELLPELDPKAEENSSASIMEQVINGTEYLSLYDPDNPEDFSRLENIKELKSVAVRHTRLQDFLEQVALVESEYSEGEKKGGSKEGVRLMTLHQAKGLEFPYVFIVGVEEGILPHSRSVSDLFELEEERRLFYVGITRAKKRLYITYARRRFIFGRRTQGMKSRFINEDATESWL